MSVASNIENPKSHSKHVLKMYASIIYIYINCIYLFNKYLIFAFAFVYHLNRFYFIVFKLFLFLFSIHLLDKFIQQT